jgi:peptidoglycan/xylan/chitin deacetylase (PgdA/CDA1 family)
MNYRKIVKKILAGTFVVYRGAGTGTRIALTFDDGPHPANTALILNALEKEGVKATFFLIGKEAEKYPELVRRIAQAGHEIGNHSYSHKRDAAGSSDIEAAQRVLADITGAIPFFFRPPWGRITLRTLGYALAKRRGIAQWSFDSRDFELASARALTDYLKASEITAGDILLFHDDYAHTVEALPEIISDLKSRGMTFGTLSEMTGRTA